jgi:hypothetical protein
MTPSPTTTPTGEACPQCHAPSYFVPGYLYTNPNGTKSFTVARATDHEEGCTVLLPMAG